MEGSSFIVQLSRLEPAEDNNSTEYEHGQTGNREWQAEHSNNDEEEEHPYECCCHTVDKMQHVTCPHQFPRLSDSQFDCESLLSVRRRGILSLRQFRTNFTLAVHCCSLPRRRVSKPFICHHVRMRWKSDLRSISAVQLNVLLLFLRETDRRCLMSGVTFMTWLME